MRPVAYGTTTLTSIADNFPGITVTDATRSAFNGYEAPDAYNVLNPWRNETHTHYHASQALGLNTPLIRESLTGQITKRAEHSWYMGVVMPMVEIPGNSFKTNTMRFEETLAPPTPAEGIPTITETKMDETTHTITRRAKAFVMEHEYMKTEKGKQHYINNLKHMSTITFEVMCYDVLYALINAKNVAIEWEIKYGHYTNKTEEEILSREKEFWCALQKQEFGFQKLDTKVCQIHGSYGINDLDTYILPMEPKDWLAVTPAENTDYNKGGQKAVDNITTNIGNAIDGSKPLGTLLGRYNVFMTRTYCTAANGLQENPMIRERHIGEFNKMFPMHGDEDGFDYQSSHRDIKIYDQDEDSWQLIGLRDALNASDMLFTEEGITNNKRHHPEGYDEGMKQHFLFRPEGSPYDANPSYVPISQFGEMKEEHLSTRTIMEFAKSCIASLSKETKYSHDSLVDIIESSINNYPQTEDDSKNSTMELFFDSVLQIDIGNSNTKEISAYDDRDRTLVIDQVLFKNSKTAPVGFDKKNIENAGKTTKVLNLITTIYNKFSKICKNNDLFKASGASKKDIKTKWASALIPELDFDSNSGYSVWFKPKPENDVDAAADLSTMSIFLDLLAAGSVGHPDNLPVLDEARKNASAFNKKLTTASNVSSVITACTNTFDALSSRYKSVNSAKDKVKDVFETIDKLATTKVQFPDGAKVKREPGFANISVFMPYVDSSSGDAITCTYLDISKAVFRDFVEFLINGLNEEAEVRDDVIKIIEGLPQITTSTKGNVETIIKESKRLISNSGILDYLLDEFEDAKKEDTWRLLNVLPNPASLISGRFGKDIKVGVAKDAKALRYFLTPYVIPRHRLGEFIKYTATHFDSNETRYPELSITISSNTDPYTPLNWKQLIKFYKNRPDYNPANLHVTVPTGKKGWPTDLPDGYKPAFNYEDEVRKFLSGKRETNVTDGHDDQSDSLKTTNKGLINELINSVPNSTRPHFISHLQKIENSTESTLCKIFAYMLLFTPINKTTLSNFIDNNLIFPIGFLIFRPHQRYHMAMAIKVKAGTEMGATYHNPLLRDYQEEDTAMTKRRFGHWSWHSKAVVVDPSKVFPVYDIFCQATLGGAGTEWFTADDVDTYQPDIFQFSGKDIFAIAVPYETYKTKMANCIDASGSFDHYQIGHSGYSKKARPLHYSTAAFYNSYWNWRHAYERGSQPIEDDHHPLADGQNRSSLLPKNTTMWVGSTWHWNNKFVLTFGKGHFGAHAYTGSQAQRNGQFQKWIIPESLIQQTV
jgi:hypothetical protein